MSSVALDRETVSIFINLCCVDDSVAWGHFLFNGNFPDRGKLDSTREVETVSRVILECFVMDRYK